LLFQIQAISMRPNLVAIPKSYVHNCYQLYMYVKASDGMHTELMVDRQIQVASNRHEETPELEYYLGH
jgi:hypothetical protein